MIVCSSIFVRLFDFMCCVSSVAFVCSSISIRLTVIRLFVVFRLFGFICCVSCVSVFFSSMFPRLLACSSVLFRVFDLICCVSSVLLCARLFVFVFLLSVSFLLF